MSEFQNLRRPAPVIRNMLSNLDGREAEYFIAGFIGPAWEPVETPVPFDLGHSIAIEAVPDWLRDEKYVVDFGRVDRELALREARFCLTVRFRAFNIDAKDSSRAHETPRSILETQKLKLTWATLSLWLAKRTTCSFRALVCAGRHENGWELIETDIRPRIVPLDSYVAGVHLPGELEQARSYVDSLWRSQPTGSLRVALTAIWTSLTASTGTTRLLHSWVALEALFGLSSPGGELTFRLAQNLGLFVGNDPSESRELASVARKLYVVRSSLVHGSDKAQKQIRKLDVEPIEATEDIARRALIRILNDESLTRVFSGRGDLRDEYLLNLAYGGASWMQQSIADSDS